MSGHVPRKKFQNEGVFLLTNSQVAQHVGMVMDGHRRLPSSGALFELSLICFMSSGALGNETAMVQQVVHPTCYAKMWHKHFMGHLDLKCDISYK